MRKLLVILSVAWLSVSAHSLFAEDVVVDGLSSDEKNIVAHAYPNPVTGTLKVEINGDFEVKIYDLLGQKINATLLESSILDDKKTVSYDVHHLPKGIYFIKISDLEAKTQKMIKIKKL